MWIEDPRAGADPGSSPCQRRIRLLGFWGSPRTRTPGWSKLSLTVRLQGSRAKKSERATSDWSSWGMLSPSSRSA